MRIQTDKLLHFLCGMCAGLMVSRINFVLAAVLVLFLAVGKEVYDKYFGGCVELKDIIATMLGGCIGIVYNLIINLIL